MGQGKEINYAKEYELVWENPNPTVSFADQTIPLSMAGKNWFFIEIFISNSSKHGYYWELPAYVQGADGSLLMTIPSYNIVSSSATGDTATPFLYSRIMRPDADGIHFAHGYRKQANVTTGAVQNDAYIIPNRIWAR